MEWDASQLLTKNWLDPKITIKLCVASCERPRVLCLAEVSASSCTRPRWNDDLNRVTNLKPTLNDPKGKQYIQLIK